MTTFGLRGQDSHSFSYDSSVELRSIADGDPSAPLLPTESSFTATGNNDDEEVEPTQAQSQQQQTFYNFEQGEELVAVLTSVGSQTCNFELRKDHPGRKWTLGRGKNCTFVVQNNQISNHHCSLIWNGKFGQQSEVVLEDASTNGTKVGNLFLKGGSTILRSGATICLASVQDGSFIFRDIEGYSARHAVKMWSKYDIGVELGRGAFAKVHQCIERDTGKEYAVKIIEKSKLRQATEKAVTREIEILHQLSQFRHEHIVTLYECFEETDSIYLILERLYGGDLLSYILRHGPIPEDKVRRMAAQMCLAVAYIHEKDVAHRDLKPENVLLTDTEPPVCKIADFGLAKIVNDQTYLKTTCGTPAYLAPEVVLRNNHQAYDNKVDSWSLGIIFFCMLTNASPFKEIYDNLADEKEKIHYFQNRIIGWEMLENVGLSSNGHDFLSRLLSFEPHLRERVDRMIDHPWISEFVPSYSRVFTYQTEALLAPQPTDRDTLACSQSFQQLHLSDGSTMAIPGLTATSGNSPDNIEPTPPPIEVGVPSFSSDMSVTTKMPGAFPKGPNLVPLPALAEGDSEILLGHTESSETMRIRNLIGGSSPLSSLSSSEGSPEPIPERPKIKSRHQPPSSKRKRANDSPPPEVVPPKSKRPLSSGRKVTAEVSVRKSTRTRYAKKA